MFDGRVPGFTPCLMSTFMVIGLSAWMVKRNPSMNSAFWVPVPPVMFTVLVAP